MGLLHRLIPCVVAAVAITLAAGPAHAVETCPFISDQQLAAAMPAMKWSLISNQDGRGCIYRGGQADTLMLTVFRNPTADRAKELYATFVKTLSERMSTAAVSGVGEEAQTGRTEPGAARPEAAVVALSGDYILSLSVYRSGRPADDALLKPLSDAARVAIGNVGKSSEKFGSCEWLTADDSEGFLDRTTLIVQRTGANSCLMYDKAANTMMVAVVALSRDTQNNMMHRNGGCKIVPLPDLGPDGFGEMSCSGGNTNRTGIYVWKNGRQASIVFAPTAPHPESGSLEHLKAVAARVYGKL